MERWRRMQRNRPNPAEIIKPGPGQESVWDYPRPPRLEPVTKPIRVVFAGTEIAAAPASFRVVETAGAPVYYLPPTTVRTGLLRRSDQTSLCEWKGQACYWSIQVGDRQARNAAWSYPEPVPDFGAIRDHFAFFAGRVDACYLGDERVEPQPGGFYGGWVTANIVGPIKGEPGTESW